MVKFRYFLATIILIGYFTSAALGKSAQQVLLQHHQNELEKSLHQQLTSNLHRVLYTDRFDLDLKITFRLLGDDFLDKQFQNETGPQIKSYTNLPGIEVDSILAVDPQDYGISLLENSSVRQRIFQAIAKDSITSIDARLYLPSDQKLIFSKEEIEKFMKRHFIKYKVEIKTQVLNMPSYVEVAQTKSLAFADSDRFLYLAAVSVFLLCLLGSLVWAVRTINKTVKELFIKNTPTAEEEFQKTRAFAKQNPVFDKHRDKAPETRHSLSSTKGELEQMIDKGPELFEEFIRWNISNGVKENVLLLLSAFAHETKKLLASLPPQAADVINMAIREEDFQMKLSQQGGFEKLLNDFNLFVLNPDHLYYQGIREALNHMEFEGEDLVSFISTLDEDESDLVMSLMGGHTIASLCVQDESLIQHLDLLKSSRPVDSEFLKKLWLKLKDHRGRETKLDNRKDILDYLPEPQEAILAKKWHLPRKSIFDILNENKTGALTWIQSHKTTDIADLLAVLGEQTKSLICQNLPELLANRVQYINASASPNGMQMKKKFLVYARNAGWDLGKEEIKLVC